MKLCSDSEKEPPNPGNFKDELKRTWMKKENITGKRVGTGNHNNSNHDKSVCVCAHA